MRWISRPRAWRYATAPTVVLALLFGYVGFVHHDTKAARPVHVTAADLLLAATTARKGISLEYDGITGPPSANHTAHAVLRSFSWGVSRPASLNPATGGRQVGAPAVSEIHVTKLSDKYSVPLLQQALVGTAKNAIIYFTNITAAGVAFDYLEFDLSNVLVTNYSFSSGGDVPAESFSLNFTKIEIKAHFPGTTQQVLTFDLLAPRVG